MNKALLALSGMALDMRGGNSERADKEVGSWLSWARNPEKYPELTVWFIENWPERAKEAGLLKDVNE